MVKFEFILEDVDALNLMSLIQDEKTRLLAEAGNHISKGEYGHADWCNKHADYIQGLKEKILAGNKRVE